MNLTLSRPWHWYAAVSILVSLGYVFVPGLHNGVVFTLLSFAPCVAMGYGMRWAAGNLTRPWLFFILGQAMFAFGDLITYNYNGKLPFPSAGDVPYLAVYPFMFIGIVMLLDRLRQAGKRMTRLDDFYVGLGLGAAVFVGAVASAFAALPDIPNRAHLLAAAYPVLDFMMGAMLWALRPIDGHKWRHTYTILIVGVACLFLVDVAYAFQTFVGTYIPGGALDFGWLLYYAALGTVGLTQHEDRPFYWIFEDLREEGING